MTRARRFEESVDVGRLTLDVCSWARAAPMPKTAIAKSAQNFRVDQVLSVGDIVWVAPADAPGLYRLEQMPEVNGAIVALDPHTGRVLAMVGGFSFGASEFNRQLRPPPAGVGLQTICLRRRPRQRFHARQSGTGCAFRDGTGQ